MTRLGVLGLVVMVSLLVGACDAAIAPSASPAPQTSATATAVPTAAPTAVTPPPASPAPSVAAATGQIAFFRRKGDSTSDIYLVDVVGSGEVRLSNDRGSTPNLVWAPDGSRLYFESVTPIGCGDTICFPMRLMSMLPDGSEKVDLGQVGAWGAGALSPDRRYLAYPSGQGFSDDATRSFDIDALVVDLMDGTLSSLGIAASSLVWSPDSTRLLSAVGDQILVVDAKSAKAELRLDDPWVEPDSPVGWSVDGKSIFYRRCEPGLNKDEAMACMAGPSWRLDLTDPNHVPQPNSGPEPAQGALSPDGMWRASFLQSGLTVGLYLTPAAGGVPSRIAHIEADSGTFEHEPSWSSDGTWLAVGTLDGIHIVPAIGGDPVFVAQGIAPAWRPQAP